MENRSEALDLLLPKLAVAMAEIPSIKKSCQGQVGNRRFKYADLGAIKAIVDPILAKHELLILQPVVGGDVHTTIFHTKSGQFIDSWISFDPSHPSMEIGTEITYRRRYGYGTSLNLDIQEDSGVDGKLVVASDSKPQSTAAPPPRKEAPETTNGASELKEATIAATQRLMKVAKKTSNELQGYGAIEKALKDAALAHFGIEGKPTSEDAERLTVLMSTAAIVADGSIDFIPF